MIRSICCLGFLSVCLAYVDLKAVESTESTGSAVLDCSKDLMRNFFPEAFVVETLRKFDVPQDQWQAITAELSERDKLVFKILAEKASKMNPNPLTNPQERQAGLKLFLETLYETFSSTLKNHGILDDKKIQEMFVDVREQTAKSFSQCLKANSKSEDSK